MATLPTIRHNRTAAQRAGTVRTVVIAAALATALATALAGGLSPSAIAASAPRRLSTLLLARHDLPAGWSGAPGGGSAPADEVTRSSCLRQLPGNGAGWRRATAAFVRGGGLPAFGEALERGPAVASVWQRVVREMTHCRSAEVVIGGKAHRATIRPLALPTLGVPARATEWSFTVTGVEVGIDLVVAQVDGALGAVEYIDFGTPDRTTALAVVRAALAKAQGRSGRVVGTVSVASARVMVARTPLGQVRYRAVGAGPPLLLIMGFGGTMRTWDPRFVNALAHRYRVVVFDNAGIGGTALPRSKLTVDAMAQQTSALITALHLGAPDVLGWSMGGMIAQALSVLHPAQVGHLVLCATYPGTGSLRPQQSAIDALKSGVPSKVSSTLFPPNEKTAAATFFAALAAYPPGPAVPAGVVSAQSTAVLAWWQGLDAAGRMFAAIAKPTLVADGTQDRLDPTANDRRLAEQIAGATLLLYDDAGHAFLFQDQSAFVPAVERFLSSG